MVFTITSSNFDVVLENQTNGCKWKQRIYSVIAQTSFLTWALQYDYFESSTKFTITSSNGVPWSTTGFLIGSTIGAFVALASEKYGRKSVTFFNSGVQILSWLILYCGKSGIALISANSIFGLCSAGIFTITPIYVSEISDEASKSASPALMMLMTSSGLLGMRILRTFVEDSLVIHSVTAVLLVQLLLVFALVESPTFYVINGNLESAKTCLSKTECLEINSGSILKTISKLKDESDRAKSNGSTDLISILKNRTWRNTFNVLVVLHTCLKLGGSLLFLEDEKVLEISGVTLSADKGYFMVPAIMLTGSILVLIFVVFWEKRYLLTISFATTSVALGILGVFMQTVWKNIAISWLPITTQMFVLLGHSIGWGIPYFVVAEIFNCEIRTKISGLLYAYSQALCLIHVHSFKYLEDNMGVYVMCYIYSAFNMYGAVYSLFAYPFTKRKSIRQIEKQMTYVPPWKA